MRFRFDGKNFALGLGAMFLALIVPVISEPIIAIIDKARSMFNRG